MSDMCYRSFSRLLLISMHRAAIRQSQKTPPIPDVHAPTQTTSGAGEDTEEVQCRE